MYICDVECDASTAAARNVHGRSEKDVLGLAQHWEDTPPHMNTLDARGLLQVMGFVSNLAGNTEYLTQDDAIEHFEMGEASDDVKEDTSEISQEDEVRSAKTSFGSLRYLSQINNNNVSSRKETLRYIK